MEHQMNKFTPGSVKGRKVVRAQNHGSIARFLKALLAAPMSCYELEAATGIFYDTITSLIKVLKAEGIVHICDWKQDRLGRYQTAVYSLGAGQDKEKPAPRTMAYRSKKSKAMVRAKNEPIFQPKTTFVGGSLWA